MNKENYLLAKANGLADRFRSDEISHRIGLEVPLSDQIAILADKDEKPDKFAKYQTIRKRIIAEVDAEIKMWEDL
jgi:hypothetical protein